MNILENTKTLPASIEIPKFIKITGKILQFISHKLAVWFSVKLFTTPITYATPKREKVMYKSAQKKMLAIPKINKNIEVLSYGYSKKKILLAHGWAGRSTQLFMVADKFLENGYMVISFDAPAHGKSTGKTTNMPEYIETLRVLNATYGPFEAAVGHSFGSMALLNIQAEKEIFNKIAIIGSADLVTGIIKRFINGLLLKPIIAKKMEVYIEKNWKLKLKDYACSNAAKKIKIPTLVIHDSKDGDVPVSCAYNIRQNLEKGSLLITNGLGHTKILRDKETMHRIVEFIKK